MSERTYKPRVGDRVRVVLEGEVTADSYPQDCWMLANEHFFAHTAKHVVSIEKLTDPEPKWVHGAAVKIPGYLPAIWDAESGHWYGTSRGSWPMDSLVSGSWTKGTLKILWNGDE